MTQTKPGSGKMGYRRLALGIALGVVVALVGSYFYFRDSKEADLGSAAKAGSASASAGKGGAEADHGQATKISGRDRSSKGITAAKAEALLSEARTRYPNIDERSKYCADLIGQLCAQGDTEEAWRLIEGSPGQVRSFQLSTFFSKAGLPDPELRDRIISLGDKYDMETAWPAYLERFKGSELGEVLAGEEMKAFKERLLKEGCRKISIRSSVTALFQQHLALSDPADHRGLVDAATTLCKSGQIDTTDFFDLLGRAKVGDSFSKWGVLAAIDTKSQQTSGGQMARGELVGSMVKENAPKAMETVLATPGNQGMVDVQFAIREWTMTDTAAASEWFAENDAKLRPEQRSGAALGFYSRAMEDGDLEVAAQWAEHIEDPKVKAEVIKNIKAKTPKTGKK